MDQHPVPRDITGFKFQLVGFMTIKQFGYVVLGLVVAFIFFKLPISFFRYPSAAFFALAGIAFAFIPIQERPLEDWVVNLVRSVYAPTQYIWQKNNELPSYMVPDVKGAALEAKKDTATRSEIAARQHQQARTKLQQYLRTIKPQQEELLDNKEKGDLRQIAGLFQEGVSTGRVVLSQAQQATSYATSQRLTRPTTSPQTSRRFVAPALSPGIIAGLVRAEDMALPGMLVHIADNTDKQIRLFKTNTAGKFSSAVPLPSGTYKTSIEDPIRRHTFTDFSFTINGEGVRPWLITGTAVKK